VLNRRKVRKREAASRSESARPAALRYSPLAKAAVLERAHAHFAYPLILGLGLRIALCVRCLWLRLWPVRVEEPADRLFGGLKAEVADEERWGGRLFLCAQDFLCSFRVGLGDLRTRRGSSPFCAGDSRPASKVGT
jgi:hypothetical protein